MELGVIGGSGGVCGSGATALPGKQHGAGSLSVGSVTRAEGRAGDWETNEVSLSLLVFLRNMVTSGPQSCVVAA